MSERDMGPLVEAICAVSRAAVELRPSGHNAEDDYTYLSDADILRVVQPALAEHGLVIYPAKMVAAEQARGNGTKSRCLLHATYHVLHRSGAFVALEVVSAGDDTSDKHRFKAMSGAYKYALRQLLALATMHDPDRESPKSQLMWSDVVGDAARGAKERGWEGPDFEALLKTVGADRLSDVLPKHHKGVLDALANPPPRGTGDQT